MSEFSAVPGRIPIIDDKETGFVHRTWFQWFQGIRILLNKGFTGTVVTAKLTGGGTPGSLTFVNGVLTAQTPAT